jgi:CheY-like chemotaxis protein
MLKILLAEDYAADVYLIRAALKEHEIDCTLRVAADGAQVMRFIHQQESQLQADAQLDLIILDLNLPRHDGLEILRRLREVERFARVPVVVLTSSDSPEDRSRANELGVARYLRKPSNLEQFLSLGAVFREILGQPQAHTGKA